MDNTNTPVSNKTPFRRLGLARSIKRSGSVLTPGTVNTPTSAFTSSIECKTPLQQLGISNFRKMRPIEGSCSTGANGSDYNNYCCDSTPATPVNTKSLPKKTRLSLSQEWKNKISHKKQTLNIKRRRLMDEVEKCTEPEIGEDNANTECVSNVNDQDLLKPSSIRERIEEVEASISVWRDGCINALYDLQARQGTGDMESLLNMLQIPHDLLNYDVDNQEFLNPD